VCLMKMKVTVEPQPREFIHRQPPETRKRLREALRDLEDGKVFPEPLDDELEGFYKLKVHRHRIIVQSVAGESGPFFRVVFAERRAVVYEMFTQILGLE
jgi:mRNA-degrading endonuclease RelE of RelBE toxin-antitoxin system